MDCSNIKINTHSSIRIEGSRIIYFDPFAILDDAHDADIIFITHEHYDHFEPASIVKVMNTKTILVAPKSMDALVREMLDIPCERCIFVDPGMGFYLLGLRAEAVAAYNRYQPYHPKSKNWVGYVVTLDDITYYVMGDTDATKESKKVRTDVCFVPIGGTYTMDHKHAAEYIAFIQPQVAIPTHYGSVVGQYFDGEEFRSYVEIMNEEIKVCLFIKEND